MESTPRSSFIPKQAMAGAVPKKVRHRRSFNIISIIVRILFAAAILSAAGLFAYKLYIEKNLESTQQMLAAASDRFDQDALNSAVAFDKKLHIAEALLSAHLSPVKVFKALEEATKASIQYTSFNYERQEVGGATVSIEGTTDNFGKVALQQIQYEGNEILNGVFLSEIILSPLGGDVPGSVVNFTVVVELSGSDIAYEAATQIVEPVETQVPTLPEEPVEDVIIIEEPVASSTAP